jgi:hypothetical protein
MTPVETLLSKLGGVRKTGTGWSGRCPAHEDQRASLSVAEGHDGRVLVKCHAGCKVGAIAGAVGMTLRGLMSDGANSKPDRNCKLKASGKAFPTASAAVAELERLLGKNSALWTYHDARGDPVGLVIRWDKPKGKEIRPVARNGDDWRIGAMPAQRPLYGLPELMMARCVIVTEGEKAADAARGLGFTATTSAGGSQAATKTDWGPLVGKEVWILPDNDAPGRTFAETVASILSRLSPAPTVRILNLTEHAPALPEGGDLADVLTDQRWCGLPLSDAAELADLAALIARLAQAVEPWQAIEVDDLAFRAFPVDALPAAIREFVVAGAKAIGCDRCFLALPLLVAMGAAVGNSRRLELKRGWYAPAILWGAIVGESGTAKTPAFRLVMRAVRERQRKAMERHAEAIKQFEADFARWEKDMTAWKRCTGTSYDPPAKPSLPQAERFVVSDTTVEALAPILLGNPRGLLLARDELAGWIRSFDRYAGKGKAGTDAANWLSMHIAESIIVDRKTGVPRTVYVPNAAASVTGGIQPAILRRALSPEHRESGLAARLLLAWPPRRAKRWTEADIDPNSETELARLFDRVYALQPTIGADGELRPVLVDMTPEAKAAWITYFNSHAVEQADLTGDLSAAWSKLEEYGPRLALVIHSIRAASNDCADHLVLDVVSMAAGIRLAEWFKHEARRVYAMLAETDTERDNRRLEEWIDRKGGSVTPREIQMGCRWLRDPGAAEVVLIELVKAGRGRWTDMPPTSKGGRPARVFTLLKASTSTEPPDSLGNEGFR